MLHITLVRTAFVLQITHIYIAYLCVFVDQVKIRDTTIIQDELTTGLRLPFNITWKTVVEQSHIEYDQLIALSDSDNDTCLNVDLHQFEEFRILLVGSLPLTFKTMHVAIHSKNHSFRFHGDMCTDKLVLMSHVGSKSGFTCRPFCGVPVSCDLTEIHDTDSTLVTSHFKCMCQENICSEILLWLWTRPGAVMPSVCEIEVLD